MVIGKTKALTFSYDDGIGQDRRLAEIFNRYGMKCTFNINSGLLSHQNNWTYRKAYCEHMTAEELKSALKGHEIAVHGCKHLDLTTLSAEQKLIELGQDKKELERIFGTKVTGMAYAYGAFDQQTKQIAKECGLQFARTVKSSHSFEKQQDLLAFNPTCHHCDSRLFALGEEFLSLKTDTPALFYVWGHSYEFDGDENWSVIEDFCKMMSGREDIIYCTNSEAFALGF